MLIAFFDKFRKIFARCAFASTGCIEAVNAAATKNFIKEFSTIRFQSNKFHFDFYPSILREFGALEFLRGQRLTSNKLFELQLSPWPFMISMFTFNISLVAVGSLSGVIYNTLFLKLSIILFVFSIVSWMVDLNRESAYLGNHISSTQQFLRLGFIFFIVSEIMFFFSLFWTFFNSATYLSLWTGFNWPTFTFIDYLNTSGSYLPLANTLLLLFSGYTLTISHEVYITSSSDEKYWKNKNLYFLLHTFFFGFIFMIIQCVEFRNSLFCLNDTVYSSIFFFLTGFHGFHVLLGLFALIFSFIKIIFDLSRSDQHLGFESAIWYWHFVDIVWLFVFVSIYIWGNSSNDYYTLKTYDYECYSAPIYFTFLKNILIFIFLLYCFSVNKNEFNSWKFIIYSYKSIKRPNIFVILNTAAPAEINDIKTFFKQKCEKYFHITIILPYSLEFITFPNFNLKEKINYILITNEWSYDIITLPGFVARYFYLQTYILILMITLYVFCFLMFFIFTHNSNTFTTINQQVDNPHVTHNTFLEATWTLVPAVIVAVLAGYSLPILGLTESKNDWYSYNKVLGTPSIMRTRVIGGQWFWTYDYDLPQFNVENEDASTSIEQIMLPSDTVKHELRLLSTYNNLVLPSITKLKFFITSTDVLHSFTIPSMFVKADACPGRLVTVTTIALKHGVYYGQCSEICGAGHSFMPSSLEIIDPNYFWSTYLYGINADLKTADSSEIFNSHYLLEKGANLDPCLVSPILFFSDEELVLYLPILWDLLEQTPFDSDVVHNSSTMKIHCYNLLQAIGDSALQSSKLNDTFFTEFTTEHQLDYINEVAKSLEDINEVLAVLEDFITTNDKPLEEVEKDIKEVSINTFDKLVEKFEKDIKEVSITNDKPLEEVKKEQLIINY